MSVESLLQPSKVYFHIGEELKGPYPLISYFAFMTGVMKAIKGLEVV